VSELFCCVCYLQTSDHLFDWFWEISKALQINTDLLFFLETRAYAASSFPQLAHLVAEFDTLPVKSEETALPPLRRCAM